jgi:hypothetical protein
MLKKLIVVSILATALAFPALAQQPGGQMSPEERALQSMVFAATNREAVATAEVVRLRDQEKGLQEQIKTLTAENAQLKKNPASPPATPTTEEKKE